VKSNVVLIGMPGAGKSTVGVVLAKRLGLGFVDTDLLLQERAGRRLQQIIEAQGLAAFRRLEEEVLLDLAVERTVVATGGSAVYGEAAMAALRATGTIVFLEVPLVDLEQRLVDMASRGVVIDPGESLAGLHARRLPLYRRWADLTVDGAGRNMEQLAAAIAALLGH
jgi:shikimate kinase